MAFYFVDHITRLESDSAAGWLELAPGETLATWVLIEAVGQLAGWIAMARTEFRLRPVAALVGEVRLGGTPAPGRIELSARIERFDGRAALYSGAATAGGAPLAELSRCVGPLLPMEAFDDPAIVRARLAALRAAAPPATHDLPRPDLTLEPSDAAEQRRATLRVPEAASFFADHFPRRPVFPAALLADAQHQLARPLAEAALAAPGRVRLRRVRSVKVRSFSPPGQVLALSATRHAVDGECATIAIGADAGGKRIASGFLEYCVTS